MDGVYLQAHASRFGTLVEASRTLLRPCWGSGGPLRGLSMRQKVGLGRLELITSLCSLLSFASTPPPPTPHTPAWGNLHERKSER